MISLSFWTVDAFTCKTFGIVLLCWPNYFSLMLMWNRRKSSRGLPSQGELARHGPVTGADECTPPPEFKIKWLFLSIITNGHGSSQVASEVALSETCFIRWLHISHWNSMKIKVKVNVTTTLPSISPLDGDKGAQWSLRWFTPTNEVK